MKKLFGIKPKPTQGTGPSHTPVQEEPRPIYIHPPLPTEVHDELPPPPYSVDPISQIQRQISSREAQWEGVHNSSFARPVFKGSVLKPRHEDAISPSSYTGPNVGARKSSQHQPLPSTLRILPALEPQNNPPTTSTNVARGVVKVVGNLDNGNRERETALPERKEKRWFWSLGDRSDRENKGEETSENNAELTRKIGYLVATGVEDWAVMLDVCEQASASESNATEACRGLRREFMYGEPAAQLSAARLWAIMLRNSSQLFVSHSTTSKFLRALEELVSSPRTAPVVRERVLDVIAAATYATYTSHDDLSLMTNAEKNKGFRGLWRRVKPADKSEMGYPFEDDESMLNPFVPDSSSHSDSKVPAIAGEERLPAPTDHTSPTPPANPPHKRGTRTRIVPPDEDIRRLLAECKIAQRNVSLLSQALALATPGGLKENDAIQEFYRKCRASQELIVGQIPWATAGAEKARTQRDQEALVNGMLYQQRVEETSEEMLLAALLNANAELIDALHQYDDLERKAIDEQMGQQKTNAKRQQQERNEFLLHPPRPYSGGDAGSSDHVLPAPDTRNHKDTSNEGVQRLLDVCEIGLDIASRLSRALESVNLDDWSERDDIQDLYYKGITSQKLILSQIPWASVGAEQSRMRTNDDALLGRISEVHRVEMTSEEQLHAILLTGNTKLAAVLERCDDYERVAMARQTAGEVKVDRPYQDDGDSISDHSSATGSVDGVDGGSLDATLRSSFLRPTSRAHVQPSADSHSGSEAEAVSAPLTPDEPHSPLPVNNPPETRITTPENLLQQISRRLTSAFKDKNQYKQLLTCRGSDAQALLDTFQAILGSGAMSEGHDRRNFIVATKRLSSKTGLYPRLFCLSDVQDVSPHPAAGGGYADIHKGHFQGEDVCLKIIRVYETSSDYAHIIKVISREAILWGQLSHPNLLPFYGLYQVGQRPALVSPWAENGNVVDFLAKAPNADRVLLCSDTAEGLAYLHDNDIIHGDLKGANVLIDASHRAYLADFGLSAVEDPEILYWTSQSIAASTGGTARWQAPEIFESQSRESEDGCGPPNTKASDIYALSCVYYEIFTGRLPFFEFRYHLVMAKIMAGARPTLSAGVKKQCFASGLTEDIWALMNDGWNFNPVDRPDIAQVISRLASPGVSDNRPPGRWMSAPAMQHDIQREADILFTLERLHEVLFTDTSQ